MNFVFDTPQHANGGCIFDDPSKTASAYVPSCPVVFDAAKHANGGCIFDDPREWTSTVRRGGGLRPRILREDDEILTLIIAATFTLH